ncbi:MAG TPA: tripartite tricarboxylate transporter substrate-binding protein [Burkholderiales bacterium]|nr:tripartite tricarboxylate transporter substrate-binding protein [Burkholderiales bacterium]
MKRLALLALALAAMQAAAQGYPSKPVRMVNPFPPGGPLDVLGRILSGALPHIKSGKLKVLAVYLTERVDELPGVPSLEGFDQKTLPFWYGLLAPAGSPREIVLRLNSETVKALRDPQVEKTLRAGRIFPIGNTPEEFGAMMREGHAAWGRVIRETGVKGE